MSFGFAIGDIVALGRLAWGLYKQCKGASAEFAEICNEVLSIYTALRELKDEAENEDSILNRAGKGRQKELNNIVQNCTQVLRQLESLVTRYQSLGTSRKKVWDRIKFGDEGIKVIRNQLVLHTSTLTLFLTSLGTGSLGRIEKKLDDIAAEIRAGHHEPTIMTAVADDTVSSESEAWRLLSTELAENFSREEIEAYRDEIKDYIRQLMNKGALEEQATSVHSEDAATRRPTSGPSAPSANLFELAYSSPVITEQRTSRWPPEPIAVSESGRKFPDSAISDTESSDSGGRPLHSRRLSDTQHNSTPLNEGSLSRKAASQSSTNVLHPHSDTAPSQPDEEGRFGPGSNIGIEIGDDECRIAAYDFTRQMAVVVPDDSGCGYIPTCVAFTESGILVGTAAKAQASKNPENTFSGFTCLLLRPEQRWAHLVNTYNDTECPGLRESGSGFMVSVPCRGRNYTLVELTAILLSRCRRLAEAFCSAPITASCITTSSLDRAKMRALAEAAEIAGLGHPKIVPNAIARAYVYATQDLLWSRQAELYIVIIDVGTHGFSVSLVNIRSGGSEYRRTLCLDSHGLNNYGLLVDGSYYLTDEEYSQDLKEMLRSCFRITTMKTGKLCLCTGSLSSLHFVQSTIQQHISEFPQGDNARTIPIPDAPSNAVKGAVDLLMRPIRIKDSLEFTLGLLIRGENSSEEYSNLFTTMNRGSRRSPWTRTLELVPTSSLQNGVCLAAFNTGTLLGPECLFFAAIKPAVIGSLYRFVVSIDCNFNMNFTLHCHFDGQDDVIQAEIHCTNSGAIHLRNGSFVQPTEDRRKRWLLRSVHEETQLPSLDNTESDNIE
jgi:Hsp70 protein